MKKAVLLFGMAAVLASAKPRTYQTGTLVDVTDSAIDIGSESFPVPLHICCVLEIRTDDVSYWVAVYKRPEELGVKIKDSIQFRVDKQTVFLRRPNGKEVRAKLLKVVPVSGIVSWLWTQKGGRDAVQSI